MTDPVDAGSGAAPPRDARARPRPRPVGSVDAARVGLATGLLATLAAAVVLVVRALPGGPGAAAIALVCGLALVPLVASPLEWYVHRFVYHDVVVAPLSTIFRVHTAHHFAFFPTWRYVTTGPARRLAIRRRSPDVHTARWRNAGVRLAHWSWYLGIGAVAVWLPAWLLTGDVAFLAGLVIASAVVADLFIVVHDTIHRPGSHRIVEAQPWFPFLDRHHHVHHVDLGANLNFLLPLADLLFGTLRTSLTPGEAATHGTLAEAKARPAGHGERVTGTR